VRGLRPAGFAPFVFARRVLRSAVIVRLYIKIRLKTGFRT
jgi:hypothetical protein